MQQSTGGAMPRHGTLRRWRPTIASPPQLAGAEHARGARGVRRAAAAQSAEDGEEEEIQGGAYRG